MNYLRVFDKSETNFTGFGLAILNNATNIHIKEVINGEYILYFILPRNDPKWAHLQGENIVVCNGQRFRVTFFEDIRENGKLTSNIQCLHVWYDSNDCKFIPQFTQIGKTPSEILTAAYTGTHFTIGNVDVTTLTDIELSKCNPAKVLNKLIEQVGGEMIRDNWTLHFVQRRGTANKFEFKSGKNLQSIRKTTDYKGLVTRLYSYGKDDLDIASVNSGVAYLDSPLINTYARVHNGPKDYRDIDDPAVLKTKALSEWSTSTKDGIDKPKVSYSCEVLELKKLERFGNAEAFSIGDTGKLFDPGIGVDTLQRIVEYDEYPYEPKKSTVGLANFDTKIYMTNNFPGLIADMLTSKKEFDRCKTASGTLNSLYVDNVRRKLQTEVNAVATKALQHNTSDMYVDNLENPTKAIIIGNGLFAIANSKTESGDFNWRTVINGDRVVADEVDTDWVYAGTVNADQINGGTITGVTFRTNVADEPRIEITGTGLSTLDSNNKLNGPCIDPVTGGFIINYSDISKFPGTAEVFEVVPRWDVAANDVKCQIKYQTNAWIELIGYYAKPKGYWDCSGAEVTYLSNGTSEYATKADVESYGYIQGSGVNTSFVVNGVTYTVTNGVITSAT